MGGGGGGGEGNISYLFVYSQDNPLAPPEEEKSHGSVSMLTYYRYFTAGGSYLFLLFLLVIFVLGEVSISLSTNLYVSYCFT